MNGELENVPVPANDQAGPPPPSAGKQALREWALRTRSAIRTGVGSHLHTPARTSVRSTSWAGPGADPDGAVCEQVAASDAYRRARTVALYLPFRGEVSLVSLLADDKVFALPRTHGGNRGAPQSLTFHEYAGGPLERHAWGFDEPPAAAPLVAASELDLILVPGLAFDAAGGRLGYGRGYYDSYLTQASASGSRPFSVGVTFTPLLLPAVPVDEHDVRMDAVVTESAWLATDRR